MPETRCAPLAEDLVERLLAGVAERRVADVMPDRDRLGEILVQAQRTPDAARKLCHRRGVECGRRNRPDHRLGASRRAG